MQEEELKQWITIVVLSAITIIAYSQMGVIGEFLSNLQRFLFGKFYFILMAIIVIQILITIINHRSGNTNSKNPLAIILLLAGLLLFCALTDTPEELKGFDILKTYVYDANAFFSSSPVANVGGGVIGAFLLSLTTLAVDRAGTVVIIVMLFLIAALLLVNLQVYKQFFTTIRDYFSNLYDDEDYEEYEEIELDPPTPLLTKKQEPAKTSAVSLEATRELVPAETKITPIEQPKEPESALDIRVDTNDVIDNLVIHNETPEEEKQHTVFMDVDYLRQKEQEQAQASSYIEPEPEPVEEYIDDYEEEEIIPATPVTRPTATTTPSTPTPAQPSRVARRNKVYQLPKINLLDEVPPRSGNDVNVASAKEKGELLLQVLNNFDIHADLIDTHIGPAVTKFEIKPEAGIKVSKILALADDMQMQLAVRDVRIEAPIPGRNAVGIEIPNVKATPVKLKELITDRETKTKYENEPLLFYLGKDLLGKVVTCRMDKMPHLLVAGATGAGKSVCMNAIIVSFLMRTKPEDVKLLLIDPKKVEFTQYRNIPHLIGPVINDAAQASNALKVIVKIMEERYDKFSRNSVRNIQAYNEAVEKGRITKEDAEGNVLPEEKMPYIVVIIDELADLMMVAGKEVEGSIQRITQLARAAGIHLIVATQRPSTDVITGIIKANIPSRIAFSVSSGIDSRTILDHVGAERLLGNGDMLYMPIGESNALRVQGAFVTDEEVRRVTEYVSSQAIPMYDDAFLRLDGVDGNADTAIIGGEEDPLFQEIKDYVIDAQKASTSLLQRRFGIGYNRAARMIDLLEQQGIIGPAQGSKPREVYIKKDSE
ncbi:MAG: DNA translocase FtsK [Solobacterium sp.]|nr:DNA translocase FtsK [Solobacterium sp.]